MTPRSFPQLHSHSSLHNLRVILDSSHARRARNSALCQVAKGRRTHIHINSLLTPWNRRFQVFKTRRNIFLRVVQFLDDHFFVLEIALPGSLPNIVVTAPPRWRCCRACPGRSPETSPLDEKVISFFCPNTERTNGESIVRTAGAALFHLSESDPGG